MLSLLLSKYPLRNVPKPNRCAYSLLVTRYEKDQAFTRSLESLPNIGKSHSSVKESRRSSAVSVNSWGVERAPPATDTVKGIWQSLQHYYEYKVRAKRGSLPELPYPN